MSKVLQHAVSTGKEDELLVDLTAKRMESTLRAAKKKGMHGWESRIVSNADLVRRARANMAKGKISDAINLLAMVAARKDLGVEK